MTPDEHTEGGQLVICEGCGKLVDMEWCWCGSRMSDHWMGDNHPAIPMGCDCYRDRGAEQ